ncbi:MAG: prepilin-type N-terminal cleavage/methylation domain-containing protein [Desulfovibrionaceae bacterium]|nr:prepilin-type N-terminal cleavage/methylation domain-containing protein [Desulfovibrionaceae bacterium]
MFLFHLAYTTQRQSHTLFPCFCPVDQLRRQGGFSLIEVIVVLVLLALLVVTFGSTLFETPNTSAALERTRMAARLAYAREQGLVQGAGQQPCLTLSKNSVTYRNMPPMLGETSPQAIEDGTLSGFPASDLCFTEQGGITQAQKFTLTFTPSQGSALNLVVEGGTGYAHP